MSITDKDKGLAPAVVLSSHTMGLGVTRSLGRMGVPVVLLYYDARDMGYVSTHVKERIHTAHPEGDEGGFIEDLLAVAERYGRCLLIPADDPTLVAVSKNKTLLSEHFIVSCTDWETTAKFIVKKHTYALAERIGVPCPHTVVPASLEEAERQALLFEYPALVKPCESHRFFDLFGRKMTLVHNPEQLVAAYQEATGAGLEVMLQEYIPGDDTRGVNYNSYVHDGKALVEFTAEKVRFSPPGFGVPRVVISKNIPDILEPGRAILKALGYQGYSCTEFKLDPRDGTYKLMEVNGRHNRSALLAVACGINFAWLEYNHLVNEHIPQSCSFKTGIYWIDELRDLAHSFKYFKEERYSIRDYLRPYFNPHIFAIFDLRDPMPFVKRVCDLGRRAAGLFMPSFFASKSARLQGDQPRRRIEPRPESEAMKSMTSYVETTTSVPDGMALTSVNEVAEQTNRSASVI